MKTILTFLFLGLLHTNLFANTDKDTSFTINGNMVGFSDSTEVKTRRSEYRWAVSFRQDHQRQVYLKREINGADTLLVKDRRRRGPIHLC
jgi:hypothetical protein